MTIAMVRVVADDPSGTDVTLGYLHSDRGGYVAWDQNEVWLGKSQRHRFKDKHAAIRAVEDAYKTKTGIARTASRLVAALN